MKEQTMKNTSPARPESPKTSAEMPRRVILGPLSLKEMYGETMQLYAEARARNLRP